MSQEILRAIADWLRIQRIGVNCKEDVDAFTAASDNIVDYRNRHLHQIDATPVTKFKELVLLRLRHSGGIAEGNPNDAVLEAAAGLAQSTVHQIKKLVESIATPTKSQGKRGPKQRHDPKKDKEIATAWASKGYRYYSELARELDLKVSEVKKAIDRHRHRKRPFEEEE